MERVIRPWGYYEVHDNLPGIRTKVFHVRPGEQLSVQRHNFRDEVWVVSEGTGEVTINGETQKITELDSVTISKGDWHTIKAVTALTIHETWIGHTLSEEDIERKSDKYGRY